MSDVTASTFTVDGYPLGQRVHFYQKRRTYLPTNEIAALENLPGWTWT